MRISQFTEKKKASQQKTKLDKCSISGDARGYGKTEGTVTQKPRALTQAEDEGESGREERIKENYAMVSRLSQQQEEQKENSYHGGHVVQTFPL